MNLIQNITVQQHEVIAHVLSKLLRLVACRVCGLTTPFDNQLQLVKNQLLFGSSELGHCHSRHGVVALWGEMGRVFLARSAGAAPLWNLTLFVFGQIWHFVDGGAGVFCGLLLAEHRLDLDFGSSPAALLDKHITKGPQLATVFNSLLIGHVYGRNDACKGRLTNEQNLFLVSFEKSNERTGME